MHSIRAIVNALTKKNGKDSNSSDQTEVKIHVSPRGSLYVDANELMRSKKVQDQIARFNESDTSNHIN